MTIEEAIAHAREVAENRTDLCAECRAEHQQLAEWLEELKDYRDKNKMVVRVDVENIDGLKEKLEEIEKASYNKAVDDMVEIIKEMRDVATAMMWSESEYACDRFIDQAEKLKEGVENG